MDSSSAVPAAETAKAAAIVQGVWRNEDLTPAEEATMLRDFGTLIHRDDDKAQADLAWRRTLDFLRANVR